MEIDKTDKAILNTLLENSRQSYRQIAKKIKKSVATVMHRINKLEKEGVIKGYAPQLNYRKLGYDIPVVIDIRVARAQEIGVSKKIAMHPNVLSVYDITGDYDVTVLARFKNRAQLDKFIKELPKQEHILKTYTRLIMNVIKEENIKIT